MRDNLYRMRENYSRKPIRFKYLLQKYWTEEFRTWKNGI